MDNVVYLQQKNIFIAATTAEDNQDSINEACRRLVTKHDMDNVNNPDFRSRATIIDSHPETISFWKLIEQSELPKYGDKTRVIWKSYKQIDGKLFPVHTEIGKRKAPVIMVINQKEGTTNFYNVPENID